MVEIEVCKSGPQGIQRITFFVLVPLPPLIATTSVTTANKVTITRMLLIPVFVGLSISYAQSLHRGEEVVWLRIAALATFVVAALSDGLDGYLARHYNQRSRLGVILDPIADKALLLSAVITLSFAQWTNALPIWFAILVIGRDIVIMVGVAIIYLLAGSVKMGPHWTSKVCTALQMLCVSWILLDIRQLSVILQSLIWAAAGFTTISGGLYIAKVIRQLKESGHAHADKPEEHA